MPPKKATRKRPPTTPKSSAALKRSKQSTTTTLTKPTPSTASRKADPTPQLRAAFDSYAQDTRINIADVTRALRVLKIPPPPADFFEDAEDEEGDGLAWEDFRELALTLQEGDAASGSDLSDVPSDDEAFDDDDDEQDEEQLEAQAAHQKALESAFQLFTQYQPQYPNLTSSANQQRRITIADLRRIAKELKEEVDDNTLRLMMEEANGEVGDGSVRRGVSMLELGGVLERAGVDLKG